MITIHESYTDSELREAAEAWINVEEADDVCDALSGLHMDRLLAPKTDEEQASNMQGDDTDVPGAAPNQASASWCRGPPGAPALPRASAEATPGLAWPIRNRRRGPFSLRGRCRLPAGGAVVASWRGTKKTGGRLEF
jgi:hypothetical protein